MAKPFYRLPIALLATALLAPAAQAGPTLVEAIKAGSAYANLNLRYEDVEQDNALKDATAMTLRTRLGYKTAGFNGFSAQIEFEDSRIVFGQDDFTVGPTGFHPGEYSVIADPETTELDQGFIRYQGLDDALVVKVGRQVITHDGHRFIGHVGWRQDRQTFDAATLQYTPLEELTLKYGYIDQRNRLFAEAADMDSRDHLFNAAYKTPLGKLVAYTYLLEADKPSGNGLDSYGVSFSGTHPVDGATLLYALEYATQDFESAGVDFDADYLFAEAGVKLAQVTVKLGYEELGSDDGAFGFSTPLATLHKFNGWSDQFLTTPAQGLQDLYLSLSGKLAGFGWAAVYHDFSADESSATVNDLGDEIDFLLTRKFSDHYSGGLKYASYDAGDAAAAKVDTDKLWVWITAGF